MQLELLRPWGTWSENRRLEGKNICGRVFWALLRGKQALLAFCTIREQITILLNRLRRTFTANANSKIYLWFHQLSANSQATPSEKFINTYFLQKLHLFSQRFTNSQKADMFFMYILAFALRRCYTDLLTCTWPTYTTGRFQPAVRRQWFFTMWCNRILVYI